MAKRKAAKQSGRGLITRVNDNGLKALRLLAIERDTTLQALGIEALNDLLKKYGRAQAVKNPATG